MKNILFAIIITFFATSTAFAASNIYKTNKQWGEVKSSAQTSEVYQLRDIENGVICYFTYIKGNANSTPSVDCVKVN